MLEMRAFPRAMILLLAATLVWVGWETVSAASETPDVQRILYSDPGDDGPCWIAVADAVALHRSNARSQLLFTDIIETGDADPIDARNMDFSIGLGPRVSLTRRNPYGWDLELAYFQVDGFAARTSVPGQSVMVTDSSSGIFATDAEARYTSALYSGEVSLRRQWTEWLNLLAGFRVCELDERYRVDAASTFVQAPASLEVGAFNHLYGLQLGADAEIYNMGGPLLVNAVCKAGVYVNSAGQNNHRAVTGFVDESLSSERNYTSFLGEIALVARYAVTRHMAFRATIEAAWLEGVALAPEQIGATDFTALTARVDAGGEVFYAGGALGCELRY